MGIISISSYNNIVDKLTAAKNKYYSGLSVTGKVSSGTILTAAKTNELFNQCASVTTKSPLTYSFPSVSVGSIVKETVFSTTLNQITAVANCYSNCHSNCHSNCNCDRCSRSPD